MHHGLWHRLEDATTAENRFAARDRTCANIATPTSR